MSVDHTPMDLRHTDREYESELQTLREQVLLMGARVEEMMTNAMKAFVERNAQLARDTMASDSNCSSHRALPPTDSCAAALSAHPGSAPHRADTSVASCRHWPGAG